MMDYEIFKEVVKEKFLDYMPQEYQNRKIVIQPVTKINRTLDSISLPEEGITVGIAPNMYVNDMYQHYLKTENLQEVLETAAARMAEAVKACPDMPLVDAEQMKENVIFQLVNTMQNKELLKNVPHREFQDLSIIYRLVVRAEKDKLVSGVINNVLAKKAGLTEEQLFHKAVENTKRITPPQIRSMNEVIREAFIMDGMPETLAEQLFGEMEMDSPLWVISNEQGINGAACMLYEDNLHKLAEELEDNLYILPSSVHEVLAVPASMGEPQELAEPVNEVNMSEVKPEDRLSNQVYHYDKDLRKLTLASDTPNKRLDGLVAEPLIYETNKSR